MSLPLTSLIDLCRTLRHSLGAGLTPQRVFRQQAAGGPAGVRPLAARISAMLERGDSVSAAVKEQAGAFPPLFLSLVEVGEETGQLPEIFGELEKYYLMRQKLRRQFRSQSMLPLIQFFLALFIIAFVIFVLGMVAACLIIDLFQFRQHVSLVDPLALLNVQLFHHATDFGAHLDLMHGDDVAL